MLASSIQYIHKKVPSSWWSLFSSTFATRRINYMWGDLKSQNDRTVEWQNDGKHPKWPYRLNHGTAERQKIPWNLKDRIKDWWNTRKSPKILKDWMVEWQKTPQNTKRPNDRKSPDILKDRSITIKRLSILSNWKEEAWKKIKASTGFEPVTSAIAVRCSTNWALKPHIENEVNLLSPYLPLRSEMMRRI